MKTIQGGDFLSEKMSEVYEAYDMEILGAVRGRGSMILKTDRGIRQISPFDGSEERLEQEREFKEICMRQDFTILTAACRTGKES